VSERGPGVLIGAGVAACAVCCVGPIAGVLAAIGIGSVAGFALFGLLGLAAAVAIGAVLLLRRRRRAQQCAPHEGNDAVTVEPPRIRT